MAYPSISTYIKDQMGHKDTVSTAFERSALLYKIAGKQMKGGKGKDAIPNAKRLGGPDFTLKFRNEETIASMFVPGGTGDFIGASSPASSSVPTYGYRDPVVSTKAYFSYLKNPIRISKIEMQQAKTRQTLIPFLSEQLDAVEEDACAVLAAQMVSGTGDGQQGALYTIATGGVTAGTTGDMYGLIYQTRNYSGSTISTTDNDTNNTHFGLRRSAYPQLVGNVASATSYTAAASETVTLTNGSTVVTIAAAGTTDFDARLGDRIFWDENGTGDFLPLGRGFCIAAQAAGAANTFQMSRQFEGTTGSYDIEIRPWFNSTNHGATGVMNVNKIIQMIDYVTNGNIRPDIAMCDSATFSVLRQTLQTQERYVTQENATLSSMGYQNIQIAGVTFCPDNYFPTGQIHIFNSDYLVPYLETGFDKLRLMEDELVDSTDGQAVASVVGTCVTSMQVVCLAPNTTAVITNLTI